jgi:predicted dinucleotide-binding enzyme
LTVARVAAELDWHENQLHRCRNRDQDNRSHLGLTGHRIVVSNSRGPETLVDFVADLGPNATAGTKQQAAACEFVIRATLWVHGSAALKDVDWNGRSLIDVTNAHMDPKPDISLAGVTRSRIVPSA